MLLASMADAVYWAGRYLERAEDTARVVSVHGDTHFDLPVGEDVGWGPLLAVASSEARFGRWGEAAAPGAAAVPGAEPGDPLEAAVVRFLVTEPENPSSVVSSLGMARENLRTAQPVVPIQAWEISNQLWQGLRGHATNGGPDISDRGARHQVLADVLDGCHRLNGVLWGLMHRDEALAFVRMGQQLERADHTTRVLSARAATMLPVPDDPDDLYDELRRTAVLRALAADQAYRRAGGSAGDPREMLRFVLQGTQFPRSVAACLADLLALLKDLPRNGGAVEAVSEAAVTVADAPVASMSSGTLASFLGAVQQSLATAHARVELTWFAAPAPARNLPRLPPARRGGSALPDLRTGSTDAVTTGRLYRVRHRTTYRFEAPAEQSYNEAHLQPRDSDRQRCLAHRLVVEPEPATWSLHHDRFGNAVTTFVVQGRFEELVVTALSEVAVEPPPAPPAGLPWETARRLLDADRLPASREARRFRTPSRLVPGTADLREYAAASFTGQRPLVEAAIDLTRRIHRDFRYEPGFTSVTTPLAEVFAHRRGVCQDFAHLGVGCLRAMGLSARYVSGYVETLPPPGSPRLVGADASHAWFAVFVPGWGWLDLDPTNDTVVGGHHVTMAWGRDFWDVSPLRGSVEGGGASHSLDVGVDVERLDVAPAGR